MAYTKYQVNVPDITDSGQDVIDDARENLEALRDAVVAGIFPDWDMSVTAGTGSASEPQRIEWRKDGTGVLAIRAEITWGTSGGSDGNPTSVEYEFTGNRTASSPTWETMGTVSYTYDSDGNVTASSWA